MSGKGATFRRAESVCEEIDFKRRFSKRRSIYLHDPLPFGLYVDEIRHSNDLLQLWQLASSSGFQYFNVDAWVRTADSKGSEWQKTFISELPVPLEEICQSFVLRVPPPFGGEEGDESLSNQLRQCIRLTYESKHPSTMLPYAPEKLFSCARTIESLLEHATSNTGHGPKSTEVVRSSAMVMIHIPLDGCAGKDTENSTEKDGTALAALKWWHQLKIALDFESNVGVALEISPSHLADPYHLIDMWRSEPVKTVILPTNLFSTSSDGTPYLTPTDKTSVEALFQLQSIICTLRPGGVLTEDNVSCLDPYVTYLRKVHHEALSDCKITDTIIFPPDLPLHKNLEESDYIGFERDVQKYTDYEAAIRKYIAFRKLQPNVPEIFIVAVVGCSRGPLVNAALNAARDMKVKVTVYALDKNPVIVEYLEENLKTIWKNDDVRLVVEDMRTWQPEQKFDIMLSEIIGGFGDNELCPECLAGPEKFIVETGVSIPQQYTSYLSPISSTKIYQLLPKEEERCQEQLYSFDVDSFKTLAEPQPVFTYTHPSDEDQLIDRYQKLIFRAESSGLLHGFAGFFVAKLYGDIEHNLLPGKQTPGLKTWSKMFFPLITPYFLTRDEIICLHFWRRSDAEAVWYEWTLSDPLSTPIHNRGGRAYRIPLLFETSE